MSTTAMQEAPRALKYDPTIENLKEVLKLVKYLIDIVARLNIEPWARETKIRREQLKHFALKVTKEEDDASIGKTIGFALRLLGTMQQEMLEFFTGSLDRLTNTARDIATMSPSLYGEHKEAIELALASLRAAVNSTDEDMARFQGPYVDCQQHIVALYARAKREMQETMAAKAAKTLRAREAKDRTRIEELLVAF